MKKILPTNFLIYTQNSLLNLMPKQLFKMRNVAVVLLSAFFLSCEDPQDISFDLSSDANLTTFFTDTFTVVHSTILLDSSTTSRQSQLLIGGHTDPIFGYTKSGFSFQPSLQTSQLTGLASPFEISSDAVFDSLKVLFYSSSYYLGDTTQKISVSLHRLNAPLSYSKRYNYDEQPSYNPTPLVSTSFNLENLINKTRDTLLAINLRLPDDVGKELFALKNSDKSKTSQAFAEAFSGFVFVANGKPLGHYGIRTGALTSSGVSAFNLYYHSAAAPTTVQGIGFEINAQRYSHMITERNGTIISQLTQKKQQIPSSETSGNSFVQSSTGLSTKITIPNFNKIPKGSLINSAFLTLDIDSTTISNQFPSVLTIVLAELDAKNNIRLNSDFNYVLVNSGLGTEGFAGIYNSTNHTYSVNLTNYLQDVTNGLRPNTSGLAVIAASLTTNGTGVPTNASLSRVVIRKAKLSMYYSKK